MALHESSLDLGQPSPARLDLVGPANPVHPELVAPTYPEEGARGKIVDYSENRALANQLGIRSVIEVDIRDPQVEADPENYQLVTDFVADLTDHVVASGAKRVVTKVKEIEDLNATAQRFYDREKAPALARWYETHVPKVLGLEVLQNVGPENTLVDGSEMKVDPQSEAYFRFVADAIGIRNRARLMEEAVLGHVLAEKDLGRIDSNVLKWISLACGAADPALKSGQFIDEQTEGEISVDFTLTDIDPVALKFADKKARSMGYTEEEYRIIKANILRPENILKLAHESGEPHDVAEGLGILEYFGLEDEYVKGEGTLWGAVNFIKHGRSLVREDSGLFLFGNMLDKGDPKKGDYEHSHPQLDFTTKVVSWPEIRPRTLKQIVRMTMDAGIDGDDIELMLPDDDGNGNSVYTVVAVRNGKKTDKLINLLQTT